MSKLRKTLPKEFADFCREHAYDWTSEDIEQCKEMLASCEPNAKERSGYKETALHNCYIPLEIVEWMVSRGADVNATNTYGTPLFKHATHGHYDICKFLVEQGADVNVTAFGGHTALFNAVSGNKCNCDVVRLLLEHGANPCHHSEDWDDNKTPLLHMLSRGTEVWEKMKADCAELLIYAQKKQGDIPSDEWMKAQEYISNAGQQFEFYKNDMSEEHRKEIEMIMERYYIMFDVVPSKPVIKHDGKSLIEVDETLSIDEQHSTLWEFLVPSSGSCATIQGEVVRITGRVDDESNRNGGANWDTEYRKMLGALIQYFLQGNALSREEIEEAQKAINEINNVKASCGCQSEIDKLVELAIGWIIQNPKPIPLENVDYNR